MAKVLVDVDGGCKMHDDMLLVKCEPYARVSVKIGVLENDGSIVFWRYAT